MQYWKEPLFAKDFSFVLKFSKTIIFHLIGVSASPRMETLGPT